MKFSTQILHLLAVAHFPTFSMSIVRLYFAACNNSNQNTYILDKIRILGVFRITLYIPLAPCSAQFNEKHLNCDSHICVCESETSKNKYSFRSHSNYNFCWLERLENKVTIISQKSF